MQQGLPKLINKNNEALASLWSSFLQTLTSDQSTHFPIIITVTTANVLPISKNNNSAGGAHHFLSASQNPNASSKVGALLQGVILSQQQQQKFLQNHTSSATTKSKTKFEVNLHRAAFNVFLAILRNPLELPSAATIFEMGVKVESFSHASAEILYNSLIVEEKRLIRIEIWKILMEKWSTFRTEKFQEHDAIIMTNEVTSNNKTTETKQKREHKTKNATHNETNDDDNDANVRNLRLGTLEAKKKQVDENRTVQNQTATLTQDAAVMNAFDDARNPQQNKPAKVRFSEALKILKDNSTTDQLEWFLRKEGITADSISTNQDNNNNNTEFLLHSVIHFFEQQAKEQETVMERAGKNDKPVKLSQTISLVSSDDDENENENSDSDDSVIDLTPRENNNDAGNVSPLETRKKTTTRSKAMNMMNLSQHAQLISQESKRKSHIKLIADPESFVLDAVLNTIPTLPSKKELLILSGRVTAATTQGSNSVNPSLANSVQRSSRKREILNSSSKQPKQDNDGEKPKDATMDYCSSSVENNNNNNLLDNAMIYNFDEFDFNYSDNNINDQYFGENNMRISQRSNSSNSSFVSLSQQQTIRKSAGKIRQRDEDILQDTQNSQNKCLMFASSSRTRVNLKDYLKNGVEIQPDTIPNDRRTIFTSPVPKLNVDISAPENTKVVLIVDSRESKNVDEMSNFFTLHNCPFERFFIPVSDFIFAFTEPGTGQQYIIPILIERKAADDLESSLADRRYEIQRWFMRRALALRRIFLIEGQDQTAGCTNNNNNGYLGGGGGRGRGYFGGGNNNNNTVNRFNFAGQGGGAAGFGFGQAQSQQKGFEYRQRMGVAALSASFSTALSHSEIQLDPERDMTFRVAMTRTYEESLKFLVAIRNFLNALLRNCDTADQAGNILTKVFLGIDLKDPKGSEKLPGERILFTREDWLRAHQEFRIKVEQNNVFPRMLGTLRGLPPSVSTNIAVSYSSPLDLFAAFRNEESKILEKKRGLELDEEVSASDGDEVPDVDDTEENNQNDIEDIDDIFALGKVGVVCEGKKAGRPKKSDDKKLKQQQKKKKATKKVVVRKNKNAFDNYGPERILFELVKEGKARKGTKTTANTTATSSVAPVVPLNNNNSMNNSCFEIINCDDDDDDDDGFTMMQKVVPPSTFSKNASAVSSCSTLPPISPTVMSPLIPPSAKNTNNGKISAAQQILCNSICKIFTLERY